MYNFPNVSLMVSANLSGHVFFFCCFFFKSFIISSYVYEAYLYHVYYKCKNFILELVN